MKARKMESFDSHEQIKNLMSTGIKESQAEAIVKTLFLSRSFDTGNLATKDQLNLVEQKLFTRIDQVDIKIDQVEERLSNKIDQVKTELENKIDKLDVKIDQVEERLEKKVLLIVKDAKFDTIKWMIGLFITMMLAIYFK